MAISIAMSLVKNPSDAQDVVQSAFVKAYKSLRSFNHDAKFSTWFYKIVVNEGLQFLRKKKRQSKIETHSEIEDGILVTFNEAILKLENQERKQMVNATLLVLKPKESLVLELHYLHDKTVAEISSCTGFSVSNVKVLLHRARKSFAAAFHHPNHYNS